LSSAETGDELLEKYDSAVVGGADANRLGRPWPRLTNAQADLLERST